MKLIQKIKKMFKEKSLINLTDIEKNILREIGYTFFIKNNNDYSKTSAEIKSIGIHCIKYIKRKNEIIIYADRPGLLIGKQGTTIDFIKRNLDKVFVKTITITVRESRIYEYLFSYEIGMSYL